MRTFTPFWIALTFIAYPCLSQSMTTGLFTGFTHVGDPEKKGTVAFNKATGEYRLEGASGNMWADHDDFHFLWKKLKGDFILRANAQFTGSGVEAHRKIGWMVRHSLEPNSPQINAVVHGDGLTSLQFRKVPGGMTEEVQSENEAPGVIQLERKGNWYIMSTAKFGEPFITTHFSDITLGNEVYVGLFLCSHNEEVTEKAVFTNVRIVIPVKPDFVPYRDYIGSHIEVMDVVQGRRNIIYSESGSLQAPNWTRDGKSLIYNRDGLLFNLDLQTGEPAQINTGLADRNNNDHVLSFDGKMLGISHHSKTDNGNSIVYTLPISGGEPKRITDTGPSYLHGWSPNGKYVIYTAERNGDYDIYRKGVNGGKEAQLTSSMGLDDGSEYTPDGRYIYFNSTRSGKMELWRMRANGSHPEQVTNDDYNNWFPHISPDGKWIVFLSFMSDVDPSDHPFYKHVYIRIMPTSGGPAKIIAYVYGGQGTMNVPSWSPDSKMIAFVSNTQIGD